jgi:hypothetical protein
MIEAARFACSPPQDGSFRAKFEAEMGRLAVLRQAKEDREGRTK